MKEYIELDNYWNAHCSECVYFESFPPTTQMYCKKLQRRITARKKPCKYFEKPAKIARR